MLLWTVINLVSNIEITFNRIWGVKKARSMYRKITDYFSMFLLMPILIVVSGGLSIFMSTMLKQIEDFVLLAPIIKFLMAYPFVLTWFMFTGLYIFMPNTKVKLSMHSFRVFLPVLLIRHSSSYTSAVSYGYRATMPLWKFRRAADVSVMAANIRTICLFGAELTYAGQNLRNFSFDKDTQNSQPSLLRLHIYSYHVSHSQTFRT